jgi:hypothetical protein
MNPTVMAGLWTLLDTDGTLLALINGRVFLGWKTSAMAIPCVTISENNEASTPRPTYATSKHRDSSPVIQIDIWIDRTDETAPNTIEDVEAIVERIDTLLFGTGVANTHSWRRVSSSGPTPEDNYFHKALRYEFGYSVTD